MKRGGSRDHRDLARLGELGDSAHQPRDDGLLALHQDAEVDGDRADLDSVGGGVVLGEGQMLGGVQQRLARDAADVEAGAPESGAFFHQADLEAELGRAERADVATRAGTDDDEVVGVHVQTPSSRRDGSSIACFTLTRKVTASRPSTSR